MSALVTLNKRFWSMIMFLYKVILCEYIFVLFTFNFNLNLFFRRPGVFRDLYTISTRVKINIFCNITYYLFF